MKHPMQTPLRALFDLPVLLFRKLWYRLAIAPAIKRLLAAEQWHEVVDRVSPYIEVEPARVAAIGEHVVAHDRTYRPANYVLAGMALRAAGRREDGDRMERTALLRGLSLTDNGRV